MTAQRVIRYHTDLGIITLIDPNLAFPWVFFCDDEINCCFIKEDDKGMNKIRVTNYSDEVKRIMLATTDGLYFSDNLGVNWTLAQGELPVELFSNLDVSLVNPDIAYVGHNNFFRTTDCGDTWTQLSIPSDGLYINEIYCDPVDPGKVFICKFQSGIYVSSDYGNNWQSVMNNIPYNSNYNYISGIAVNPLNPDNIYVNSYDYGIFISNNGGESWEEFNEGLRTRYADGHTIIDPTDTTKLYLGTDAQSVWSITRTPTSIDDIITTLPTNFSAYNYPNPFNASTNIVFTLPNRADIRIDIYDMLGRRVEVITDRVFEPGYHAIRWQNSDINSGVYFYKITADDITETGKMMYLK